MLTKDQRNNRIQELLSERIKSIRYIELSIGKNGMAIFFDFTHHFSCMPDNERDAYFFTKERNAWIDNSHELKINNTLYIVNTSLDYKYTTTIMIAYNKAKNNGSIHTYRLD